MIKLWKNNDEYDLVNENEIKKAEHDMGSISFVYEFCDSISTGFICNDCIETWNLEGCKRLKKAMGFRSSPGLIEVTFKGGSTKFYEKWEKIDEI